MVNWPWKKRMKAHEEAVAEEKRDSQEALEKVLRAKSRFDEVIEQMKNTQEERHVRTD